jgi:hypothetical protein
MLTRNIIAPLALGLMVAAGASPSLAQRANHGGAGAATGRDAAVHECSVAASKWSNTMWQTQQFAAYSNCMVEHGQQP